MTCDLLWKDAVAEAVNHNNQKDLSELFHRLNNELGIILSHAELLEAKCDEDKNRSRAAQVVSAALEAMGTARQIRAHVSELTLAK
jgi:signal transduction histidine kinase